MPNIFTLGQTRDLGSRGNRSGREEVAGGGAGEVLERCWRREERAHTLATSQGWKAYRTGFGKLD